MAICMPDVIQSLEEECMEKEEQWKKLMSVRHKIDVLPKSNSNSILRTVRMSKPLQI